MLVYCIAFKGKFLDDVFEKSKNVFPLKLRVFEGGLGIYHPVYETVSQQKWQFLSFKQNGGKDIRIIYSFIFHDSIHFKRYLNRNDVLFIYLQQKICTDLS